MDDHPPRIWSAYQIFVIFMGVLFLAVTGLGSWLLYMSTEGPSSDSSGIALGALVAVLGGLFAAAYCLAPFVTRPRWAWSYHLFLLVLGLFSGVGTLFALPLLVLWFRPRARHMFD